MKKWIVLCLLLGAGHWAAAQDSSYIARHLQLDEVVIRASRVGFDIPGFIKLVEQDTTFYKAFKNLRILGYQQENDIRILNKDGSIKASLLSTTQQVRSNGCRSMKVLNETTTGPFYGKNHSYTYYTAELYASLFFTQGKVCGETNIVRGGHDLATDKPSIEKRKDELKQLIFNPGQPVSGVPIVGKKVAIFDDRVAPMYAFSITSQAYHGHDCYVFSAILKPDFQDAAVIRSLITYFDKKTLEIVYRDYRLSYNALIFNFNVHMQVEMTHVDSLMVPEYIHYDGLWKIPFHKLEHAVFNTRFEQFKAPSGS